MSDFKPTMPKKMSEETMAEVEKFTGRLMRTGNENGVGGGEYCAPYNEHIATEDRPDEPSIPGDTLGIL